MYLFYNVHSISPLYINTAYGLFITKKSQINKKAPLSNIQNRPLQAIKKPEITPAVRA